MKDQRLHFLLLSVLFAVLMSLPYMAGHCGLVALVGFLPLLFMDALADIWRAKHFFWWYYLAFVLWNAITTFWVCNATVGGGIFAVLANALQMAAIFAVFRWSKSKLGDILPYLFLAVMWIAWERAYFSAQISWPWLTLGNAFARSTRLVQWYSITGSLGGSLWVWLSNISLFLLLMLSLSGRFREMKWSRSALLVAFTAVIIVAPAVISRKMYDDWKPSGITSLDVVIGQPNFDPYQKFQSVPQEQQNVILLDLFESAADSCSSRPVLFLAPETFTSGFNNAEPQQNSTWNAFQVFLRRHPSSNIMFGASTYDKVSASSSPDPNARHLNDSTWYISHNSAVIVDSTGRTDIFHKSKLVVGTELTPFPRFFTKVDDMLGGVMGRCVGQDEVTTLPFRSPTMNVPLGCAVCYESVYGEYCTGYVRAGARAMTVITNDAWWGDTPGYRQHLSYSRLRAIELGRDIARCGNTGISAFINSRGDVVSSSKWWTRQTLCGKVCLSDRITPFVRHGDVVGRICTLAFLLLLALLVSLKIMDKIKEGQDTPVSDRWKR